MSRLLQIALLAVVTPFIFGQACGVVESRPVEVTDEMRAACTGWSDSKILTEVANISWQHEAGFTYLETLDSELIACPSWPDGNPCVPCKQVIVDYVYGR